MVIDLGFAKGAGRNLAPTAGGSRLGGIRVQKTLETLKKHHSCR
jgi:hypothetical protein